MRNMEIRLLLYVHILCFEDKVFRELNGTRPCWKIDVHLNYFSQFSCSCSTSVLHSCLDSVFTLPESEAS